MFSRRLTKLIALSATAIGIGGGAYGIITATAGTASRATATVTSPAGAPGPPGPGFRGANARSGPAAGGSIGTVASLSASGFTLTTPAGQTVTVETAPATTYRTGTSSSSASAVKNGQRVLVLGTTSGTTITASVVIVRPAVNGSTAPVVPFQRGAPSTAKQVGQVPASYTQGAGTIVGGTTANKATTAALAAYPGGIVDRVVRLANGEYEVHTIGVNWPHHIFVSASFKVVGAN
jgi:hypothetical protein